MQNDKCALAKYYELKLTRKLTFKEVSTVLEKYMINYQRKEGLLINNFATVNSGFSKEGKLFKGRLYGVLIANNEDSLIELDSIILTQLDKFQD